MKCRHLLSSRTTTTDSDERTRQTCKCGAQRVLAYGIHHGLRWTKWRAPGDVSPGRRDRPKPAWTRQPLKKVTDYAYDAPIERDGVVLGYVEHERLECGHHFPPKTDAAGRTFPAKRRCPRCPKLPE